MRMEWVASSLALYVGTRSIQSLSADPHSSTARSRLNWHPRRFKWNRPFRWKTKSGFCACAITFRTCYNAKGTGYPLHSQVSPSLPLPASPCAITFQLESTTDTSILQRLFTRFQSRSKCSTVLWRNKYIIYKLSGNVTVKLKTTKHAQRRNCIRGATPNARSPKFNFEKITWYRSIVKPTRCTNVSNLFYFEMTLCMFRTVFPSIIRSSRLYYIQQKAFVTQILLSAC